MIWTPCRLKIDSTYTWNMFIRVQLISTLVNIVVQWQNQLSATSLAISLMVLLSYIAKKLCIGNFSFSLFVFYLIIVCHWLFPNFLNLTFVQFFTLPLVFPLYKLSDCLVLFCPSNFILHSVHFVFLSFLYSSIHILRADSDPTIVSLASIGWLKWHMDDGCR